MKCVRSGEDVVNPAGNESQVIQLRLLSSHFFPRTLTYPPCIAQGAESCSILQAVGWLFLGTVLFPG